MNLQQDFHLQAALLRVSNGKNLLQYAVYCTLILLQTTSHINLSTSTVAATQEEIAPLMFDMLKIAEYHPSLGTAEIVGDIESGVGK